MTDDVRRARRAYLWVGVIIPAVITLLSTLVLLVWLPQIPDPAAIHWSGGGGPDGFGPAWTYLAIGVGVPIGAIVLFGALALVAHRLPQSGRPSAPAGQAPAWSPTARFLGATTLGLSGMMSVTMLASVGVQRGLEDAADAPDTTGWVIAGFVVMLGLGVVGWFVQPTVHPAVPGVEAAEPIALGPGERAAWFGQVSLARSGWIVLGVATLVVLASTVLVLVQVDPPAWGGAQWTMIAVAVLMVAIMLLLTAVRVRVDASGLHVRPRIGWPHTHIPLEEITRVEVVEINPFAEFGGWGWRMSLDGRRGFVLRRGPALQLTRRGASVYVVTVDGADQAAAVLDRLREDAASRTHPHDSKER